MNAYSDTSFLCALYRPQFNSSQAAMAFEYLSEPLHVTSLLLFEFRQSMRFQIWLHAKDKTRGFGAAEANRSLSSLQADLAGKVIVVVPADWSDVHAIAERLSAQHTLDEGHRAMDILHVATALHLGASRFLSFDEKQRRLAAAEGLATLT